LREAERASCISPLVAGVGDALFGSGRREEAELRVERRGDAAERAVVPRANAGGTVEEAEEEIRLVEEGGFAFEAVAMLCTWKL
jgi:hypothetical protein